MENQTNWQPQYQSYPNQYQIQNNQGNSFQGLAITGVIITTIGLIALFSRYWFEIGIVGRCLVAILFSSISLILATYFNKEKKNALAVSLYALYALSLPFMFLVLAGEVNNMNTKLGGFSSAAIAFVLSSVSMVGTFILSRRKMLEVFAHIYGFLAFTFAIYTTNEMLYMSEKIAREISAFAMILFGAIELFVLEYKRKNNKDLKTSIASWLIMLVMMFNTIALANTDETHRFISVPMILVSLFAYGLIFKNKVAFIFNCVILVLYAFTVAVKDFSRFGGAAVMLFVGLSILALSIALSYVYNKFFPKKPVMPMIMNGGYPTNHQYNYGYWQQNMQNPNVVINPYTSQDNQNQEKAVKQNIETKKQTTEEADLKK